MQNRIPGSGSGSGSSGSPDFGFGKGGPKLNPSDISAIGELMKELGILPPDAILKDILIPGDKVNVKDMPGNVNVHETPNDRDLFARMFEVAAADKDAFFKMYDVAAQYEKALLARAESDACDAMETLSNYKELTRLQKEYPGGPEDFNKVATYTRLLGGYYSRKMGGSVYLGSLVMCVMGMQRQEGISGNPINGAYQQIIMFTILYRLGYLKIVDREKAHVRIEEPYFPDIFNKMLASFEGDENEAKEMEELLRVEKEDTEEAGGFGLQSVRQMMNSAMKPGAKMLTVV
jgi:hypothetical protein